MLNRFPPRLSNWVKLARSSVDAEVPHFEMLHTVASFLTAVKADEKGDETVERLAFAFGFNPETRIKLGYFFTLYLLTIVILLPFSDFHPNNESSGLPNRSD